MQKCAICHSADYVAYQSPSMTQAQWTGEMAKMQHAYGAPISDDEVRQLGAYLAVAYGSAKATDPEVMAASTAPAPAAAAATGIADEGSVDLPFPHYLGTAHVAHGFHECRPRSARGSSR